MLGVQAIALYADVICDWHISDNCVYYDVIYAYKVYFLPWKSVPLCIIFTT